MKEGAPVTFADWLVGELRKRGYEIDGRGGGRSGGRKRLADELGVTGPTVSRILSGQVLPELDTMLALSRTLGIDLPTILVRTGRVAEGEFPPSVRDVARQAVVSRQLSPEEAMDAWGIHDPDERAFLELAIRRARKDRENTDHRSSPSGEGTAKGE